MAQARRDHERFGNEPAANGKTTSIMRHLISNPVITLTGPNLAIGTCLGAADKQVLRAA